MLEFIFHKKLGEEYGKPSWLVVYCRKEAGVTELGFAQATLSDTQVTVDFSTTRIVDEEDRSEFEFEVAQYLVERKELIMGEDGDYYLPVEEKKMEKETKIVLAIKGDRAIYLFQRDDMTEFVVGWIPEGTAPKISDYVEYWESGHYFRTLEDAAEYLNKN